MTPDSEMFGCDIEKFEKSVYESITYKAYGLNFVVTSILSDVQAMIALGQAENARQTINRIKYLLIEEQTKQKAAKERELERSFALENYQQAERDSFGREW